MSTNDPERYRSTHTTRHPTFIDLGNGINQVKNQIRDIKTMCNAYQNFGDIDFIPERMMAICQ